MILTFRQSVLATIAYRGIFSFFPSRDEILLWLIGQEKLKALQYRTNQHTRMQEQTKWKEALKRTRYLRFIPTVDFIGVTGGLAAHNAADEDDIDVFLIVEPGTIFITRFLSVFIGDLLGIRRRYRQTRVKNLLCFNYFLSRSHLAMNRSRRNLYTAFELLQCKPVLERRDTYRLFLSKNSWVRKLLPTAWRYLRPVDHPLGNKRDVPSPVVWLMRLLEYPAKLFELWHMRSHRTDEIVSDTEFRFHPQNRRQRIADKFAKKLRRYNIPLDKIFYAS